MSHQNSMRVAIPAAVEYRTLEHMTCYELPEPGACSKEWQRHAAADFAPTTRQQLVLAAVERALAVGHFYSADVNEAVAIDLGVTPEQRARNSHQVEGGDFGFDVYYAQHAVAAAREHKRLAETAAVLELQPGVKVGTLRFNDGSKTASCVILSAEEGATQVVVQGKRGAQTVSLSCSVVALARAVQSAHEHGLRPDGFDEFKLTRARDRAGPLIAKVAANLVRDMDETSILASLSRADEMPKHVFLALQRRVESMELAAAQGQDCLEGFDAEHAEVTRLLDAAPWTLHPDHGCVSAADLEELDRQCEPAPV